MPSKLWFNDKLVGQVLDYEIRYNAEANCTQFYFYGLTPEKSVNVQQDDETRKK